MQLYHILLLICLAAGVISEAITISIPERVLKIEDATPQEIFQDRFYKLIFILSGFYLVGILLMFFTEEHFFRLYAAILLLNSVIIWTVRKWLMRFRIFFIVESTVCLILLLDSCRVLIKDLI